MFSNSFLLGNPRRWPFALIVLNILLTASAAIVQDGSQAGISNRIQDRAAELVVLASLRGSVLLSGAASGALSTGSLAAALVLVLAALIAWHARRSRSDLARQVSADAQRLSEMEVEMHRLNEARERLGRDLHDRIIQSIYAIGLNLDDCARCAGAEPDKVPARLRSALGDVNAVISALRNIILGLETDAIQPAELRAALKSLGVALGHEKCNRIRLAIDDDALSVLTPGEATELVHVAREAMSNSLRHGAAQTTTFILELRGETIRFLIEDDGVGFDARMAESRGFGLRNMAKRAEHLGATFAVRSEEGAGTRVVLDIPRKKQHLSAQ